MRKRILPGVVLGATVLLAAAPGASAAPSCTAQFTSVGAQVVRPFGRQIVVPELRNLTLGGPNLGQEVKILFATADREACLIPPPAP
jgi:hypothetical protein